jgi:hypothetical protein
MTATADAARVRRGFRPLTRNSDSGSRQPPMRAIRTIHTLGPAGTNCEAAARHWLSKRAIAGRVRLHITMDAAAEAMMEDGAAALLSDVAYRDLHSLIYGNVDQFRLVDIFLMPTDDVVLASATGREPIICSTHPTMQGLIPPRIARHYAASSVQAARDCASGITDGCLTTPHAADRAGLKIIRSYRDVVMGFTIHAPLSRWSGSDHGRAASFIPTSNGET